MKITVNANIGGTSFVMDDDAYSLLKDYLNKVSSCIATKDDKHEILNDIERRISELLTENGITHLRVVTIDTVKKVVNIIGEPSIFGDDADSYSEAEEVPVKRRLMRDSENVTLGGVCSGFAAYLGIDITIIRVLFVFLLFFGGSGVILYIVAWIIIPKSQTEQDIKMMREMHNK